LSNNLVLVTHNQKHFGKIKQLELQYKTRQFIVVSVKFEDF
jgi:hypothetical protein